MKKFIGGAIASLLVVGGLTFAPAAFADDAVPIDPAVVEMVVEEPTPETVPEAVDETVPEVVEETPEVAEDLVLVEVPMEQGSPYATPSPSPSNPYVPEIEFCTDSVSHPTATNLSLDGWNVKVTPNSAFVDGGLHLESTDSGSAWAQKTINTPFSNIGSLVTDYSDKTNQYTFGVILTLNDWDQQIHYDEDGRYWTDIQGIFPDDSLKGGYYETYDLEADLQEDVTIQTIVLYVNAGQGGLTIHSQGYQCGTQPFDYEETYVPEPTTRTEVLEDLPDCDTNLVTITTKYYETPYQGEETLVDTVVTTRPATNDDFNALECEIIPGDILATCVGDVPYLSYDVDAPQEGPLTITFVNPDGENYVVEDADRSGTILWPGASLDPQGWPGWVLNDDGSYSETDGNFAWTRDGVTVAFDINPHYETTVDYPEASALCANPPVTPEVPSGDELAQTGGSTPLPWTLGGLALIMGGLSTMFFLRRQAMKK